MPGKRVDKGKTYTLALASQQASMIRAIEYVRRTEVNSTEFGSFVEQTFRSALSTALPDFVGVTNGFVEDAEGRRSLQMDVILYDKQSASPLLDSGGWMVLPVECTYACCEVKTTITASTLKDDVTKKCESYKLLQRTARLGVEPVAVNLFGKTGEWRSLFFCFAYRSDVSASPRSLTADLSNPPVHSRIDSMFALAPRRPSKATALINVEGELSEEGIPPDGSVGATPTPSSQLRTYGAPDPWTLAVALLRRLLCVPSVTPMDITQYLRLGSDAIALWEAKEESP